MFSREISCARTLTVLGLFVFVHVTSFKSNKFGLSHNCAPDDLSCGLDVIYCVDSKNSSAVCNITCTGLFACSQATFVVANSGGLVLNCLGTLSCQLSTIEWVNSDNLHNYTAVNSSAAIGGPLRVLSCDGGDDACADMSVDGDTQEQGLGTTTEWNCAGYGSCQRAQGKFKGAVFIHCNETQSCLELNVTCLSGGNCRTKSNRDSYSVGSTMYCMPGVQHCECGNYWDCITFTAAPIPTSTRIQTTSTTATATQALVTTSFQTTDETRLTTTLSQTSRVPTQSTSLTETPYTKTPMSSTTLPNATPKDDEDKDKNSSVWMFIGIVASLTFLILGLIAGYCFGSRKKGQGSEEQSEEPESDGKVQMALICEEAPGAIRFGEEDTDDSVQKPRVTPYAYYAEEEEDSEQLEGKPRHIGERPTAGGQVVAATNSGDEMSSKELNDEMMYLSMPETHTAGGRVTRDQ